MSRVAAIDCGTNSIRLLIADVDGSNMREIVREMRIVRLGEGVDTSGSFKQEAIDRTLAAVAEYKEIMIKKGVEDIRFCATSATRDAKNRALFIDGVKELIGVEPEVIPGEEEAALSFIGAVSDLKNRFPAPYLVVDIGGGSTEFVIGTEGVEKAKSVNIGCVRMRERHLKSQPPTSLQVQKAVEDIDRAIADAARTVPITEAKTVIAVAGTATTVAAASLELEKYDPYSIHGAQVPAFKVLEIAQRFALSTPEQIAALGYMHEGRVDVITAGALILSRVMIATRANEFIASETDILDGIARGIPALKIERAEKERERLEAEALSREEEIEAIAVAYIDESDDDHSLDSEKHDEQDDEGDEEDASEFFKDLMEDAPGSSGE
jgi:exopolyphosphatase/guanosine-5'-triphosphate,3'-diphosphate pyrophosphatase